MKKLSYEEWKVAYTTEITEEVRQSLSEMHNIDVDAEIEAAIRQEYEVYLTCKFDE
jgi:hypothetical protein